MINETAEEKLTSRNPLRVFWGLLVGGMAGAITALLLAPQSGKDTRKKIQEKGVDLRTQATKMVNDKVEQARSTMTEQRNSWQKKIEELKQVVQDLSHKQTDS